MKCVVPGANVKVLAKAIHALAKIGDEMYIEPQSTSLSFRTVNMANSAYADFTFYHSYFSYYVYGDLQENDALKCKISMRSAMTVFKTPNTIDKQVETCHIRLEPDASEILFILKYKNSIIKTHLLPILDCEILQTAYDKDCATNQFSSQARVLGDAMQNFHQNLIEITLEALSQKLLLRNYVDDTSGLSNTTRTQLALGRGEFDRYDIKKDTSITFCMKEFKAFLNFAEIAMIPIGIYFEQAGKPVIFGLKNPSFDGILVLSTLSSGTDSQTDTTISDRQEKSVKRRGGSRRASKKPSKSATKFEKKAAKNNKTLASASAKDIHPCLIEKEKQTNKHTAKEKESAQLNVSNRNTKNNTGTDRISYGPIEHDQEQSHSRSVEQKNQEVFHNNPSTSYNASAHSKSSKSTRELVSSVFSTITKRKSVSDETDRQERKNQNIADIETFHNIPSTSYNTSTHSKSSKSTKEITSSVFSTITKRKSVSDDTDRQEGENRNRADISDTVPNSPPPPAKKARLIFQKCFQKTFDPRMLPGYDIILAEDSDEPGSE